MNAIIVEDESLSAQQLRAILESIGNIEIVAQLDSIDDTVEWFESKDEPDLLFLDIHLADGSAFEIFNRIEISCPIIFTTAYDEYALSAFKVNSISYLLKPIKETEVQQALNKLKALQGQSRPALDVKALARQLKELQSKAYKTHFLVSQKGDKLVPLKAEDIAFIHIQDGLVKAHTFEAKVYYMDLILDELMVRLDPHLFFRANRQFIISRNAVRDIDHWFQSRLSLNLTVTVPQQIVISRARVPEFKQWFTGENA